MAEVLPRVAPSLDVDPQVALPRLFHAPDAQGQSEGARAGCASGHPKAQPIWLEIGFGGGEHLLARARRHPDVGLIGAEPFEDGIVKVLSALEDEGLANIAVHPDDVRALLRWLPEASIARAFVLFPDPWPKRRHAKRRLVNRSLLVLLARVLRPGAELLIATDIGDYARTMLMAVQASPELRWTATCADDWRRRPADWVPTRYEAKALREGRQCYFITLVRR
jgi:tRNA (guanine-N7-)-methyltransferase